MYYTMRKILYYEINNNIISYQYIFNQVYKENKIICSQEHKKALNSNIIAEIATTRVSINKCLWAANNHRNCVVA